MKEKLATILSADLPINDDGIDESIPSPPDLRVVKGNILTLQLSTLMFLLRNKVIDKSHYCRLAILSLYPAGLKEIDVAVLALQLCDEEMGITITHADIKKAIIHLEKCQMVEAQETVIQLKLFAL